MLAMVMISNGAQDKLVSCFCCLAANFFSMSSSSFAFLAKAFNTNAISVPVN